MMIMILTEALELVALGNLGFIIGESALNLKLINNDAVVVDFTERVSLAEIVPADLVVEGDVVAAAQT